MLTRLREIYGSHWSALVSSALLFGTAHLYQGPIGTIAATIMGVLFGLIYLKWPRLWPLVFIHSFWNMLVLYFAPRLF